MPGARVACCASSGTMAAAPCAALMLDLVMSLSRIGWEQRIEDRRVGLADLDVALRAGVGWRAVLSFVSTLSRTMLRHQDEDDLALLHLFADRAEDVLQQWETGEARRAAGVGVVRLRQQSCQQAGFAVAQLDGVLDQPLAEDGFGSGLRW